MAALRSVRLLVVAVLVGLLAVLGAPSLICGGLWPQAGIVGGSVPVGGGTPPAIEGSVTTKDYGESSTINVTTGEASNTYLLVFIHVDGTTASSAMTHNGDTVDLLDAQNPPGSYGRTEVWGRVAPDVGDNLVLSWTQASNHIATAVYLSGVHQTTSVGTIAKANGTGTAVSTTATTASGDLLIDGVSVSLNASETATVGANQTSRWNLFSAGALRGAGSSQLGSDGGAMTWTLSASLDWAQIVVPMKPAA